MRINSIKYKYLYNSKHIVISHTSREVMLMFRNIKQDIIVWTLMVILFIALALMSQVVSG